MGLIHLVEYQLDYYYKNNYPRRYVAEIVGCSVSTVRKYSSDKDQTFVFDKNGGWHYSEPVYKIEDELKILLKDRFPDEKEHRVFLPTDGETDYYWYAGYNGPYQKKKEKPIIAPINDLTQYNIKLKYGYDYIYSNNSGIYMLAQAVCIPNRINERHFLIKVGMSTHLNDRIKSYKGMNPFAICVDTLELPEHKIREEENKWHNFLRTKFDPIGQEWFSVKQDAYISFLEAGFKAKI